MAGSLTKLSSCRAAFTRRLPFPYTSPHTTLFKKAPCWSAAAACSYHTRPSHLGVHGRGAPRRTPPHHLLRSASPLTTHTALTSPLLLNTPTHRHFSSLGDAFRSVFLVRASSPLDEDVASGVDSNVDSSMHSHMTAGSVDSHVGAASVDSVDSHVDISVDAASLSTSIPPPPLLPSSLESAAEAAEYIPLPPAPPEGLEAALNAIGEPTFTSQGLGGWTPIGLIQNCLEWIHVSYSIPWWGTIAIATVIIRTLLFPLVVVSQRNAAKMNNHMPQLQVLQMKMTEARNSGDQLNAARYSQEMVMFMKEKQLSPMRNIIVPFAQAPIFISMFIGLRRMANLPVDSLKDGGLAWFMDLTIADPYYMLPLITSFTMLATIELGTDGAKLSSQNMQLMKYGLRALPFIIFPFTMNFPAAILCYWVSTNLFSLVQVGFLRLPAIRDYFNIDQLIKHKPETLPQKKKGAVEGFKDSWKNMKIAKEIEERHRYDEMRFKKAGTGPIMRTYTHDPTKKVINVQAKVKK